MARLLTIAALLLLVAVPATARDRAVAMAFQAANPCPSTGLPYGSCPGWIRDHVMPLCAGGADAIENMQWQSVEDAKAKDQWEFSLCRGLARR